MVLQGYWPRPGYHVPFPRVPSDSAQWLQQRAPLVAKCISAAALRARCRIGKTCRLFDASGGGDHGSGLLELRFATHYYQCSLEAPMKVTLHAILTHSMNRLEEADGARQNEYL